MTGWTGGGTDPSSDVVTDQPKSELENQCSVSLLSLIFLCIAIEFAVFLKITKHAGGLLKLLNPQRRIYYDALLHGKNVSTVLGLPE